MTLDTLQDVAARLAGPGDWTLHATAKGRLYTVNVYVSLRRVAHAEARDFGSAVIDALDQLYRIEEGRTE